MANDGSVVIDIEGDSSKFEGSLSKLGSVASGALKGLGVASAAAAGAVVAVGKAAVTAYADYEQLVGGVETLFKDSASIVEGYAANAYKTAGLSANAYMETVTSFSASLLQSVGGDTAEAARVADMAITDMADNANKMGTSISSIQWAYQGFAKQNYTMLDNLKLGYGGTKAEMERLLADAEKLTGVKYDISNLNDVYEAIHVIQTELGITGTTAREASTTIQGSVASMKAAWENLLVGLADDTQDFDALLTAFIDSVGTVGENLIPRIQIVLNGIVKLVTELGPMLADAVPGIVSSVLPGLISGATALVGALVSIVPDLIDTLVTVIMEQGPSLIQAGLDMILSLVNGISSSLPQLTTAAVTIITTLVTTLTNPEFLTSLVGAALGMISALVQGITEALPTLIAAAPVIIQNLVTAITDSLPLIVDCALSLIESLITGIADNLPLLVDSAISIIDSLTQGLVDNLPTIVDCALTLITTLVNGLVDNLPLLVDAAITLILALIEGILSCLPDLVVAAIDIVAALVETIFETDWLALGADILEAIIKGILSLLSSLLETAGKLVSTIWDKITNTQWFQKGAEILTKIVNGIKSIFSTLGQAASTLVSTITDKITNTQWFQKGAEILTKIVNGIRSIFSNLGQAARDLVNQVWNTITNTNWLQLGGDIIRGIANGVSNAVGTLVQAAKNVANSALNAIKGALGISSPSKVFAKEVGRWIPPGIGTGMEDAMPELTNDMRRQLQHVVDDANIAVAAEVGGASRKLSGSIPTYPSGDGSPQVVTNENGISVIVYYTGAGEPEDVKRIGREIGAEAARELRRKGLPTT